MLSNYEGSCIRVVFSLFGLTKRTLAMTMSSLVFSMSVYYTGLMIDRNSHEINAIIHGTFAIYKSAF